jgi:hypothetical protein
VYFSSSYVKEEKGRGWQEREREREREILACVDKP